MKKKRISLLLALILCLGLAMPAAAASTADLSVLTEAVYDYGGDLSEGLIWMSQGTTVRYFDTNGKVVIDDALKPLRTYLGKAPDMDYVSIGDFHEGLARVLYYDESYEIEYVYFIDQSGKTAFQFNGRGYYFVGECGNGVILASTYDDESITVFDKQGNITKKTIESSTGDYPDFWGLPFSESLLAYYEFNKNDASVKVGYVNTNFKVAIPAQYDDVYPFNDGLAAVQKGELWGVIDKTGKFVIQPQFDGFVMTDFYTRRVFVDGIACVSKNGKYGCIDTKGNTVIPFKFDTPLSLFLDGYTVDENYNIMDTSGNIVLKLNQYDDVNPFIKGVSLVGIGGKYSIIDLKGNKVSTKTWQFDWTLTTDAMARAGLYFYGRGEQLGLAKLTSTEITYTATPTTSKVLVNGEAVSFDAYNINDNNYFKLRDLAYVLSGTEKQFEVTWDGAKDAISLISGKAYTAVGGEMAGKGTGAKTATATTARIYLDGKEISLTAYNIDGNNYFKLRDIGQAFDFGVDWDGAASTIAINTSKGYTPG